MKELTETAVKNNSNIEAVTADYNNDKTRFNVL